MRSSPRTTQQLRDASRCRQDDGIFPSGVVRRPAAGAGRVGPAAAPSAAAAAAANGGVVPRGLLVNVESALGEIPTLHFKSDKAFLTAAEVAARAAAANDLQASLQAQIAEKAARKEAEQRAEQQREAAELVRLPSLAASSAASAVGATSLSDSAVAHQ
jgi:hypothetical protein